MISWWMGLDSNQRSETRQIYSLLPLTTREPIRLRQKELYKITAKLSTTFLKNILQKPNLSFTHAKIRL